MNDIKRTRAASKTLSVVQNMKLCNLIVAEYANSDLSDADFAKHVSKELGFEVQAGAVNYRRGELGLENNTKKIRANNTEDRIDALNLKILLLTQRLTLLEQTCNVLFLKAQG